MSNDHWAENEEEIALYLRGRYEGADRQRRADHLLACAACRERVRTEQVVAAGVRLAGRSALRDRLRVRLAQERPRAVPWPRILSTAAVLLVVGGLVVLTRWREVGVSPPPIVADAPAPVDDAPPPAAAPPPKAPRSPQSAERPLPPPAPGAGAARATSVEEHAVEADAREMSAGIVAESAQAPEPVPLVVLRESASAARGKALAVDAASPLPRIEERRDTLYVVIPPGRHVRAESTGSAQTVLITPDSLLLILGTDSLALKLPRPFPGGVRLVEVRE